MMRHSGSTIGECTSAVLALALFAAGHAHAICPTKPVTLCQIVADNEFVLRAKLISKHLVVDERDPEGTDGWIYHFDVITNYR
jgi:hypothetical protein